MIRHNLNTPTLHFLFFHCFTTLKRDEFCENSSNFLLNLVIFPQNYEGSQLLIRRHNLGEIIYIGKIMMQRHLFGRPINKQYIYTSVTYKYILVWFLD